MVHCKSWRSAQPIIAGRSRRLRRRSAPAEQPLDVAALQLDLGRPAVAALSGVRRRFHLAQQRVHLLDRQLAPGPDAAVAGHRGADRAQPFLQRQRSRRARRGRRRDRGSGREHRARRAAPAPRGRRRRPAPNGSMTQAEAGEFGGAGDEPVEPRRRRVRPLPAAAAPGAATLAAGEGPLQALVHQAFVRRVLIDDDDAVGGLGDDEGAVQLRPREAERRDRPLVGGRRRRPPIGGIVRRASGAARRRAASSAKPGGGQPARSDRPGSGGRARRPAPARSDRAAVPRHGAPAAGVAARWPAAASACFSAPTISPRTRPASRKRTSVFIGWTLTSTSSGGTSRNSATTGWRSCGDEVVVGAAHRAVQQPVAHRPAVDEQELRGGGAPVEGRQPGEAAAAATPSRSAATGTALCGEVAAEDRLPAGAAAPSVGIAGRGRQRRSATGRPRSGVKPTSGRAIASRCTASSGVRHFRLRRLQELQPRRRGEEQVAHLDPRARRMRRRPGIAARPASTAIDQALAASRGRLVDASAARRRRSTAAPRRGSRGWRCG